MMAATVSHELRNPLAALIYRLQSLQDFLYVLTQMSTNVNKLFKKKKIKASTALKMLREV